MEDGNFVSEGVGFGDQLRFGLNLVQVGERDRCNLAVLGFGYEFGIV